MLDNYETNSHFEADCKSPKSDLNAKITVSPSNSLKSPNWTKRRSIFYLFIYVVIFTNYDSGVIPAALNSITREERLSFTEQGLLGSLPYFGISVASFFVSYIINRLKVKKVLLIALALNIAFCLSFVLFKNLFLMYFSRFFMGFTQAFWIIYGPVWTNYFSPIERQTTWLGLLQGFSPLGKFFNN